MITAVAVEVGGYHITLKIKTANGEVCEVQSSKPDRISTLKQRIRQRLGNLRAEEWQYLLFNGEILRNHRTIESYGIESNSILFLGRCFPEDNEEQDLGIGLSGMAITAYPDAPPPPPSALPHYSNECGISMPTGSLDSAMLRRDLAQLLGNFTMRINNQISDSMSCLAKTYDPRGLTISFTARCQAPKESFGANYLQVTDVDDSLSPIEIRMFLHSLRGSAVSPPETVSGATQRLDQGRILFIPSADLRFDAEYTLEFVYRKGHIETFTTIIRTVKDNFELESLHNIILYASGSTQNGPVLEDTQIVPVIQSKVCNPLVATLQSILIAAGCTLDNLVSCKLGLRSESGHQGCHIVEVEALEAGFTLIRVQDVVFARAILRPQVPLFMFAEEVEVVKNYFQTFVDPPSVSNCAGLLNIAFVGLAEMKGAHPVTAISSQVKKTAQCAQLINSSESMINSVTAQLNKQLGGDTVQFVSYLWNYVDHHGLKLSGEGDGNIASAQCGLCTMHGGAVPFKPLNPYTAITGTQCCPSGHPMPERTPGSTGKYAYGWVCDMCRASGGHQSRHVCEDCTYDICNNCWPSYSTGSTGSTGSTCMTGNSGAVVDVDALVAPVAAELQPVSVNFHEQVQKCDGMKVMGPEVVRSAEKAIVHVYTGNNLYQDLNASLRAAGETPCTKWTASTQLLRSAVEKISMGANRGKTLYRGQPSLYGASYNIGDVVNWYAFTSLSTNLGVTKGFAKEGIIFHVVGVTEAFAASISSLSVYPSEEEVLLTAGTALRVVARSGNTITMEFVGPMEKVRGLEPSVCSLCAFEQYIGRTPFHQPGAIRLLQDPVFQKLISTRNGGIDQIMVHKFQRDGSSTFTDSTAEQRTWLYCCSKNNLVDVVVLLLQEGANASLQIADFRSTALHAAAYYKHPDVIRLLLGSKASVEERRAFAAVRNRFNATAADEGGAEISALITSLL